MYSIGAGAHDDILDYWSLKLFVLCYWWALWFGIPHLGIFTSPEIHVYVLWVIVSRNSCHVFVMVLEETRVKNLLICSMFWVLAIQFDFSKYILPNVYRLVSDLRQIYDAEYCCYIVSYRERIEEVLSIVMLRQWLHDCAALVTRHFRSFWLAHGRDIS